MPQRKSNSKNQKKFRPNRKRGLYGRGQIHALNPRSSPYYAPPFPTEFSVALTSCVRQNIAAQHAIQRYVVPLLEYLSYDPLNLVQLYTMYEFSKVTAVTIHYEISNYGAFPIFTTSAVLPQNEAAAITPIDLGTVARARTKLIGAQFGTYTLRQNFPAEHYMGNVLQTSQYWVDAAQSVSLTPISTEEPVTLLTVEATPGENMSFEIVQSVTFHVQFFQPRANRM